MPRPRATGYLQVAAGFEYPLVAQTSSAVTPPPVALPVLTEVTLGAAAQTAADVARPMADFIEGWLQDKGLTPETRPDLWPLAKLVFDVSVFSSGASVGPPILQFRRLELPVAAVPL